MKIKVTVFLLASVFSLSCQQKQPSNTNTSAVSVSTTTNVSVGNGSADETSLKEAAQFKVIETAYNVSSGYGSSFLSWTAVIENPNQDAYGIFPTISVVARDENGAVVGTEDQVLGEFPPGIKMAWAGQLTVTKPPKTVEITPLKVEWRTTKTKPTDYLPFQSDKVNITKQGKGTYKVTGDVTNPYNEDVDQMAVIVLLRNADGKLLSGGFSFVDTLPAKAQRPFSVDYITTNEKVEKTEIYAFPWGNASWNDLSWNKASGTK